MIWDDDTPITLKEACEKIFRNTIKPATLMAEAERGNLQLEKIGRRYFTTPKAIRDMREKCRKDPKVQDSTTEKAPNLDGSSGTETAKYAQAALKNKLSKLKNSSLTTLPKNTNRQTASIHELSR
jgi:hypothetical protein